MKTYICPAKISNKILLQQPASFQEHTDDNFSLSAMIKLTAQLGQKAGREQTR